MSTTTKPLHVTVVGGGFGGVRAALGLASDPSVSVVLITDRKDFQYYPALYGSATGRSHLGSWISLGEIFADHPNIHVYLDSITDIDSRNKRLTGSSGTVYDYHTVIFAIGVVTTYFDVPGLETYAYGIKNEFEIKRLKQRLFTDIAERHQIDKNYVVVGAGPTGVELAAAMGTYIKQLCVRYGVRQHNVRIRLIEASPRVLQRSSQTTSRRVLKRLRHLGVTVELNKRVERENAAQLIVSGNAVETHTVIWTSGVANNPFFAKYPELFPLAPNGRVAVDAYLRATEDIYVIGDNAATRYTGLAQTALHNADYVVRTIRASHKGRALRPYRPRRPVQAVPVGRYWAVIEWRFIHIYGRVGAIIQYLANLHGYTMLLPILTALSAWRSVHVREDDYFTPSATHEIK